MRAAAVGAMLLCLVSGCTKTAVLVPLVVKFQVKRNWLNEAFDLCAGMAKASGGNLLPVSLLFRNPDVYFLLRIDGQDPLIIPEVHNDCLGRPVNQTILYDNSLKGRRAIVEIWDSHNNVTMNNIRAMVSGTRINMGAVQGAVSANISIDGKEIGPLLKNSDEYICQAEVILGQSPGSVQLDPSGGTLIYDVFFEILPSP